MRHYKEAQGNVWDDGYTCYLDGFKMYRLYTLNRYNLLLVHFTQ